MPTEVGLLREAVLNLGWGLGKFSNFNIKAGHRPAIMFHTVLNQSTIDLLFGFAFVFVCLFGAYLM